ncbi:MAG: carboxylating nicotinate-nucleotide diphosphorylase [Selenomonadales bacterium]|jgi:nicotinate-nucleotide pyrophosphorylase (carboxylating)|nr:carboxylating nicotinate-nucleotide diphosphorylase [Selenomonadales bacterium]MBQ2113667.1 carboxylating nicotinate-nucleotide diphosphorylase [Selenomonadales bacterium]MBQ2245440.1 carboxylating nicotinate-nucleotide diphosphorylase [Selenomonadales bacterium]MBQ5588362.1 carboxylating nicotinate-nucleotide diphosphorylase [Selenomonadales bacterium]
MYLSMRALQPKIIEWLNEDVGSGDITTENIIPQQAKTVGLIQAKQRGIVAGINVAGLVFTTLAPDIEFTPMVEDGDEVEPHTVLAKIEGDAHVILTGERLALNLLQHMSGIATLTSSYARLAEGTKAHVVDTRKTLPGLRMLEKYAIRVGGGRNHRMGLYDAVMIKDNHIKVAGGIKEAVRMTRNEISHTVKIEVETETLDQVKEALEAGADIIMLDNMSIEMIEEAVALIGGRAIVEASGGVTKERLPAIAKAGVDIISIGALTNSAPILDISLDIGEIKY